MSAPRPIVVQQSFPVPRPTTNPYIVLLLSALRGTPGLTVRTFSWRAALLGRYDVFHAHWPEILVSGRGRLRTAVRQLLFVLLLVRLAASRTPIVRTVHNLELPSGLTRVQTLLLRWFDRRTTDRIALNDLTPGRPGRRQVTIPHGHYSEWFAAHPRPAVVPGRFAYFGLIRRYKNVEALADAFTRVPGDVSLTIAGAPSSDELAAALRATADRDPRIDLRLGFQSDAELVAVASEAELVVLPYRHMHNSGGVLAALSLGRPVLVPRNAANEALAAEVGPGWVLLADGEIDAATLCSALAEVRSGARTPAPDLSARDWDRAGEAYLRAYSAAIRP